ncbi:hypothetical protein GCM10028832_09090 [Streptomyces sparsus]
MAVAEAGGGSGAGQSCDARGGKAGDAGRKGPETRGGKAGAAPPVRAPLARHGYGWGRSEPRQVRDRGR